MTSQMIGIFQNPFSNTDIKLTRPMVGASSHVASCTKSSSWSIKDEYVSSSSSSDTYKRPSISAVSLPGEEIVPKGTITDKMREEISSGDSYWSAMGLLSVATPMFDEIVGKVMHEKGIVSDDGENVGHEFYMKHSFSFSINPDGVFIFNPKESYVEGLDQDAIKDVCLALEDAFSSSSLNMEENPHLFTKAFLPQDYDPAEWGRTIEDREEWSVDREPDFIEFVDALRSDIFDLFSDMHIVDFSMKIDDQGKLTITGVETNGPTTSAQTLARMNKELTDEIREKAEYLGLLALSGHNGVYGDVRSEGTILEQQVCSIGGDIPQFKHEVIFTSGTDYKVVRAEDRSLSTRTPATSR